MNNQILNNLYEFWEHIGELNDRLNSTERYSSVSMDDSDWPNRIFDLKYDGNLIGEIKELSKKNELPEIITITKPNNLYKDTDFEFIFGQKNMAFGMDKFSKPKLLNPNIKRVSTENDAIKFATTASKAFGYIVDKKVVCEIINQSNKIKLFTYQENSESLGCGIIFFDSNDNAGLHMIGTLPKGRGKGIGKNMTEHLLIEAKEGNVKTCVLHASLMGESIYTKLGFKTFGEIETYRILRDKNN